jgi:hypothetical protein
VRPEEANLQKRDGQEARAMEPMSGPSRCGEMARLFGKAKSKEQFLCLTKEDIRALNLS